VGLMVTANAETNWRAQDGAKYEIRNRAVWCKTRQGVVGSIAGMMPSMSIWTRLSLKLGRSIRAFTPGGKENHDRTHRARCAFVCLLCGRRRPMVLSSGLLMKTCTIRFCCGPNDCKPLKRAT
jgi:hypothetical protein